MKSTLLASLGALALLCGAAPATAESPTAAGTAAPAPLGLHAPAEADMKHSEAQSVIRDDASEMPNTGGVVAGDATETASEIEAQLGADGAIEQPEQQAETPSDLPAEVVPDVPAATTR